MIKSIYVDNFKALNNFQMELESFTVIVGNNMSGKSTVLQALDFIANMAKEDFGVILERRGWKVSDLKSQMQKSPKITIICNLELIIKNELLPVRWEIQILAYTQKNIMELSHETVEIYGEGKEKVLLSYTQSKGGFIWDGSVQEAVTLPKLQTNSSVLKMMDVTEFPVLQALKMFLVNSDSFEMLSPEKMRLSSRGDVNTIGNAGEKLPSFVKSMNQKQKAEFIDKIKLALGEKIVNVDARTKGKPGWTHLVTEEQYRKKSLMIESKNMSDGTLRLLAFLAICEMDKRGMMLLDEIENGINLDYAEKIVRILEDNCNRKSSQMIVTTHSPIFLDYVEKESIRYMYREPQFGNCKCNSLAEIPELNEKMRYLYPGELFMNMSNNDIIKILLAEEDA
ncbi:MAG: ATP-binding protein [Eubacteriales bacterium]|nr:ATP-binding protein [Eubacteriales bacterium]